MSDYRSLGSNYHPSSQSRKISIGVMPNSQPNRNPGDKGDNDVIARKEKLKSATVTDVEAKKNDKGDLAAKKRNSAQGKENVTSPWRSPRSSYRKLGTLESVLSKGTSSLSGSKGLNKGLNGVKQAQVPDSFQNIPISSPQHSNGGRNDKGMEEPSSPVLQKNVSSMDKPEKDKNGSTDALRSKLRNILGKGSSANQDMNLETPEAVNNNSKLNQKNGLNDDILIKPRHSSDSIETDSESPENATRRPVTRSLLQRRVGAKGVQKRTKTGANLGRKSVEQVTNVFAFEEGVTTVMNSTVMPKKQRGRRKNTVVKCRKVQSRKKDEEAGVIGKETSKSETPPRSDRTGTCKKYLFSENKRSSWELHAKAPISSPSPKSVEPENEFQSPMFGYKPPISSLSPCFSPDASPLHPKIISTALDETEIPIFSFGTKKTSQGTTSQASDKERRSPDFLEKKKGGYSFRRASSPEPNEDLVLSDPSSVERDSQGSEKDSPALGGYNSSEERETTNWRNEKSKLGLSSAKRNSNHVVLSPTTSVSEGIHKTDSFKQFSEMDEDEGLGRAVALFVVALQNFEKKLKSAAKKKSSEIIASVSEEIHLELENVKSHIITETGKTSNLAKTKRKLAETRLEEQQEKMRMIHEKFKDDVGNHLEDFKNTIEGLEANHSELKGAIKKQRTSHQKLIEHFEEGIETKLDNATKRIDSINKCARGKMLQLKMIVAECLKDDD